MKLLSLDPSGNKGKEGQGTTGYALFQDGRPYELNEIKAKDYDNEVAYWQAHEDLVMREWPDAVVFEGYRLYNHRGKAASMQANSELQTPQLIGVLKLTCYKLNIPYTVQFASEVKNRWSEDVLVRTGVLGEKNKRYYWNEHLTNSHKRDALRHGLHFWRYKYEKNRT